MLGILKGLTCINYLISPKFPGSKDHVYFCYEGPFCYEGTVYNILLFCYEEHRYLDHENSVYLGFSMTFDKSYFFLC